MNLNWIPATKIINSLCENLEDNYDIHKRFLKKYEQRR